MREFGDLEMAIMDVLWADDEPLTVREVRERLRYGRPLAYTTVMTVLDILHRKAVLRRDKQGRAWRYWPAEAREERSARLMAETLRASGNEQATMRAFLQRVSDGERETLLAAAMDFAAAGGPGAVARMPRAVAVAGPR